MDLLKTWERRAVCHDPPEILQTKALALGSLKIVGLAQGQGRPAGIFTDIPRMDNILWREKRGHEISCCGTYHSVKDGENTVCHP